MHFTGVTNDILRSTSIHATILGKINMKQEHFEYASLSMNRNIHASYFLDYEYSISVFDMM